MYRPPNWKNPYQRGITAMEQAREDACEVGADLMLKGLRAEPAIRLSNKLDMDTYVIKIKDLPDGIWRVLLIPEEA